MTEIDSYQYWLDQIEGKSEGTKELYTIYFQKFCEYTAMSPNELIEMQHKGFESSEDPREDHMIEGKVRGWLADTKASKASATRRAMLTAVRSFFSLNLHPLRLNRMDVPRGRSMGSRIPEKHEVIAMADAAKWKYRAAVMFLKDSGLRISDVVRVTWEDKVDMGDGFWNFNILTRKTGVEATAFVGPETTRLLEQFKTKTGRIFGTAKEHMDDEVNALTKKANLKGVTAHGLRKYFKTSLQHARVQEEYILRMMGKKASVYSESRRSQLFEAYRKAYAELSIYAQKEQEEENRELRRKVMELDRKMKVLDDPRLLEILEERKKE